MLDVVDNSQRPAWYIFIWVEELILITLLCIKFLIVKTLQNSPEKHINNVKQ